MGVRVKNEDRRRRLCRMKSFVFAILFSLDATVRHSKQARSGFIYTKIFYSSRSCEQLDHFPRLWAYCGAYRTNSDMELFILNQPHESAWMGPSLRAVLTLASD